jgi:CysZ protein
MFKSAFKALSDYRSAIALINEVGLWRYFAVPMIISVVIFSGVAFTVYGLSDNLGRWISGLWVWDWGSETFLAISTILGGLIIAVLGLLLYKHLVMALSAPFMSPVSEKIEKQLYPHLASDREYRKTNDLQQLIRGLRINLRNLSLELCITVPLLLLSFIPLVGFVTTPLIFLVQSYYAGFGNMDYTLERHFRFRESVNFIKSKRGFAVGNGIVFMLLALIPIIGVILVLPISVTAASKTTLEILNEQPPNHTANLNQEKNAAINQG